MEGPFDAEAAAAVVEIAATPLIPLLVFAGVGTGVWYALNSHYNEWVLYGLLVEENLFGTGYVYDVLGVDEYIAGE